MTDDDRTAYDEELERAWPIVVLGVVTLLTVFVIALAEWLIEFLAGR